MTTSEAYALIQRHGTRGQIRVAAIHIAHGRTDRVHAAAASLQRALVPSQTNQNGI